MLISTSLATEERPQSTRLDLVFILETICRVFRNRNTSQSSGTGQEYGHILWNAQGKSPSRNICPKGKYIYSRPRRVESEWNAIEAGYPVVSIGRRGYSQCPIIGSLHALTEAIDAVFSTLGNERSDADLCFYIAVTFAS